MDNTLEQAMLQGLTEQEACERLAMDGYNELPSAKRGSQTDVSDA